MKGKNFLVCFFLGAITGCFAQYDLSKVPDINRAQKLVEEGELLAINQLCDSILRYDPMHIGANIWPAYIHHFSQKPNKVLGVLQTGNIRPGGHVNFVLPLLWQSLSKTGKTDLVYPIIRQMLEHNVETSEGLKSKMEYASIREEIPFKMLLQFGDSIQNLDIASSGLDSLVLDHTQRLHPLWSWYDKDYDLTTVTYHNAKSKKSKTPKSLLIWLNDIFPSNPKKVANKLHQQVFEILENPLGENWIIASPMLYNKSNVDFKSWGWLSGEGLIVIEELLEVYQNHFQINPEKIYIGGYNQGADWVWYLAQHMPDKVAGFLAFGGHPGHLDAIKFNTSILNYTNSNFLAYTTKNGLYDYESSILPYYRAIKENAPQVSWSLIEELTNLNELDKRSEEIAAWLKSKTLENLPSQIKWQTPRTFPSRKDPFWIAVRELSPEVGAKITSTAHLEISPFNNQSLLWAYWPPSIQESKGIPIIRTYENGAFHMAGIQRGDVLLTIDGLEINSLKAYGAVDYLFSEKRNMQVPVEVQRGAEFIKRDIQLSEINHTCFYSSDTSPWINISTRQNDIDILVEGIQSVELKLSDKLFDPKKEITILKNGRKLPQDAITPLELSPEERDIYFSKILVRF